MTSTEQDESGKIDFEKEAEDAIVAFVLCERGGRGHRDCPHPEFHMEEWGRSIAARVYEQARQRCAEVCACTEDRARIQKLPHIYAPKKEGTE